MPDRQHLAPDYAPFSPWLEVMPVEPAGLVPGGIVQNEQLPHVCLLGHGLGELVQKALEHVGVYAVDDEGEEFAALRGDGPDDVLPDMIAQVRHSAGQARLHPSAAGPRIAFDAGFIPEP